MTDLGATRPAETPLAGAAPFTTVASRMRGALRSRRETMRGRLAKAMRAEELAGLTFAFWARCIAAAAVALWLIAIVPAPRSFYYLAVVGVFVLLGLIPHLLRRHRFAEWIKLVFIALDAALIVVVIVVPPPLSSGNFGWPIQMRLRFQDYLYLLLLLAGSALSYSPRNVIWTGACIIAAWTTGFLWIYFQPDTITYAQALAALPSTAPLDTARAVLDPRFVALNQLTNQIALTAIATGLLAAAVARARRTLVRQTRAEVTRADLARYVSPDVADAMAARPEFGFGQPAVREVAILFADIVGFTGKAEKLPPERVVALLRSFHTRSCRVVFAHGGTLDKFMGDGFMATFGTLGPDPDAARKALACAFELQSEMERWREKRVARGAPGFVVAAGLHYGPVVVGNVGADRRLEFTVVGDAVNVANRLERLTREHGCRIALSREAIEAAGGLDACPEPFHPRGEVTLRGRRAPVELYVWPGEAG